MSFVLRRIPFDLDETRGEVLPDVVVWVLEVFRPVRKGIRKRRLKS